MTTEEAIKQLDLQLGRFHPDLDPVPFNAIKLGIKALERQREEDDNKEGGTNGLDI